jgi:selenide,water dikinase
LPELTQVLRHVPQLKDSNLLVGIETRDDAAVYRLNDQQAIVFTTDFFPPVVDDPYDFGQIAAANALSDVYAMGATPLLALNLVLFPTKDLPMEVLYSVLEGGSSKVTEAGALLVGGHSIEDKEPKYGLAVVGLVPPEGIFRNVGAEPGDHLILTKPLGTGILTTAIKRGLASDSDLGRVTSVMSTLNRAAADVFGAHRHAVHALTDVTGYGLLGHLFEMLDGSQVGAELCASAIPLLDAVHEFVGQGVVPGGTRANVAAYGQRVATSTTCADAEAMVLICSDAQTSGGLLAAVAPEHSDHILAELQQAGVTAATRIGSILGQSNQVNLS